MICYAFPLAHEASDFLKECTQKESFSIHGLHCTLANFRGRPILVALVGMGQVQASENAAAVFQFFRPRAFILAGYGGALVPQMQVGQITLSNNFTSDTVQPFLRILPGFDFASFCTTDEVVGTPEKRQQYALKTESQVAEMETAAVAEVVYARQIPFLAVRVISDDFQQVLPTGALAAGFDPVKGRATPLRLLGYLATHPGEFGPFKKFVSGLGLARKKLTQFLQQLNDELPSNW
jgi:adenosylhomocysteine nucleosidase